MRVLATLAAAGALLLALGASSFATTTVVRDISGSAGDWTYSYTLTNGESLPIWQWAVWFTSDAEADVLTAGTTGWATTNLNTQGFFPEEYTSAWGCHVYDSSGIDLAGPNGEPGFYGTHASDYTSGNSGQYWDGTALETNWADRDWDKIWLGEDYGWNGAGADIQTSYGIPVGGTGQFTVHSTAAVPQTNLKSFSFNTIDYWYSYFDGTDDHLDFEGSGTVVPEPLTMMGMFLGLGSVGAYIRRRRRA